MNLFTESNTDYCCILPMHYPSLELYSGNVVKLDEILALELLEAELTYRKSCFLWNTSNAVHGNTNSLSSHPGGTGLSDCGSESCSTSLFSDGIQRINDFNLLEDASVGTRYRTSGAECWELTNEHEAQNPSTQVNGPVEQNTAINVGIKVSTSCPDPFQDGKQVLRSISDAWGRGQEWDEVPSFGVSTPRESKFSFSEVRDQPHHCHQEVPYNPAATLEREDFLVSDLSSRVNVTNGNARVQHNFADYQKRSKRMCFDSNVQQTIRQESFINMDMEDDAKSLPLHILMCCGKRDWEGCCKL
eukprot:TRINITY_DN2148_c0_g1_i1.p1 TRINITY_DN2148_c0_g1~~TRINITY_DN2148_c0_g1_i1.p1  ORF type:complete len:302 (-),score=14.10 TRINITY_DN2148_c0_g1_i1:258-1163(-)